MRYATISSGQNPQTAYYDDLAQLGPAEAARRAVARAASPVRLPAATAPAGQSAVDESWVRSIERVAGSVRPA